MDLTQACCMCAGIPLPGLNLLLPEHTPLLLWIREHLNVQVGIDNRLPTQVCILCVEQMHRWKMFRARCSRAQVMFYNWFENHPPQLLDSNQSSSSTKSPQNSIEDAVLNQSGDTIDEIISTEINNDLAVKCNQNLINTQTKVSQSQIYNKTSDNVRKYSVIKYSSHKNSNISTKDITNETEGNETKEKYSKLDEQTLIQNLDTGLQKETKNTLHVQRVEPQVKSDTETLMPISSDLRSDSETSDLEEEFEVFTLPECFVKLERLNESDLDNYITTNKIDLENKNVNLENVVQTIIPKKRGRPKEYKPIKKFISNNVKVQKQEPTYGKIEETSYSKIMINNSVEPKSEEMELMKTMNYTYENKLKIQNIESSIVEPLFKETNIEIRRNRSCPKSMKNGLRPGRKPKYYLETAEIPNEKIIKEKRKYDRKSTSKIQETKTANIKSESEIETTLNEIQEMTKKLQYQESNSSSIHTKKSIEDIANNIETMLQQDDPPPTKLQKIRSELSLQLHKSLERERVKNIQNLTLTQNHVTQNINTDDTPQNLLLNHNDDPSKKLPHSYNSPIEFIVVP